MNKISTRTCRHSGKLLDLAIDGEWGKTDFDRVTPDKLQFVPNPPSGVEVVKPTKVYLRTGADRVVFKVASFEIEPVESTAVTIRHYTLGAEIHD